MEPEARINDETRATYNVVNPVCQECAAAGKRPVASCKKSRMAGSGNEHSINCAKVNPQYCIAHPYCAYFHV